MKNSIGLMASKILKADKNHTTLIIRSMLRNKELFMTGGKVEGKNRLKIL